MESDNAKVLITGSSGFIGINLVGYLTEHGYSVLGIDTKKPADENHTPHWRNVDVMDAGALEDVLADFQPQYIVHLAARTDLNGRSTADYRVNFDGTRNLLAAAGKVGSVKRVIVASTRLVNRIGYTPSHDRDYCPTTPYGESKVLAEEVVRSETPSGIVTCIVRPTSIWGPWFAIPYRTFFDSVLKGSYLHPRGMRIRKSFGYVGNVVYQLGELLSCPADAIDRGIFYLADYEPIEVGALAQEIAFQAGRRPVREVPLMLLNIVAVAGDLCKTLGLKNPPLTRFRLDNLLTEMIYDTQPLKVLTGPLPFDCRTGVAQTLEWMQAQR